MPDDSLVLFKQISDNYAGADNWIKYLIWFYIGPASIRSVCKEWKKVFDSKAIIAHLEMFAGHDIEKKRNETKALWHLLIEESHIFLQNNSYKRKTALKKIGKKTMNYKITFLADINIMLDKFINTMNKIEKGVYSRRHSQIFVSHARGDDCSRCKCATNLIKLSALHKGLKKEKEIYTRLENRQYLFKRVYYVSIKKEADFILDQKSFCYNCSKRYIIVTDTWNYL